MIERRNVPWSVVFRGLLIVAVTIGCGVAVYSEWSTLAPGVRGLVHLRWRWYPAAGFSMVLSMIGLAMLQRTILRANGSRLSVTRVLASGYAANALAVGIPVIGDGMAGRLAYQRFRAGGADAATASLTLTVAGIVSAVTMSSVVAPAGILSGNPAAAVGGFLLGAGCLAAGAVVLVEARTERGQARLHRMICFPLRCSKRLVRRPRREPEVLARLVVGSLAGMRLGASTLATAAGWALVNWWADVASLDFALRAARIDNVSFGAVLLVWTAGSGAGSLSPTPAGIGVVEVAMIAALRAAGADSVPAVTAIVLYRLVSLKEIASVWAAYYAWRDSRQQQTAAVSAPAMD